MPTTRSRNSTANTDVKKEPGQLPTPAPTPKPTKASTSSKPPTKTPPKRKRAEKNESPAKKIKKEEEGIEQKPKTAKQKPPSKSKSARTPKGPSETDLQAGSKMAAAFVSNRDSQRNSTSSSPSKSSNNTYGFSPGTSPYPHYPHPTPAECKEVARILSKAHGAVSAPKTIPQPSLNNSGCGEVPSVLDALVRTRLSAATNNANSSRAFKGLVERFGTLKSGVGKGSVDWDAVRRADQKDVFEAIKSGGLADVKSRHIQQILQMVYEENQERKKNLQEGGKGGEGDKIAEDESEKKKEVAKAESSVLSLDHLHLLDSATAFDKLLTYPGIGPKTASCVLLFCMQRPSFAVDTHVFRLTKWLGWVPSDAKAKALAKALAKEQGTKPKGGNVTRESAYAHLDVRVPDELKYQLHYLLIKHGKNCAWCSAKAGREARVGVICPLAGLMKGKGRSKGGKRKSGDDGEEEDDVVDEESDDGDEGEEEEEEEEEEGDVKEEEADDDDDDDDEE